MIIIQLDQIGPNSQGRAKRRQRVFRGRFAVAAMGDDQNAAGGGELYCGGLIDALGSVGGERLVLGEALSAAVGELRIAYEEGLPRALGETAG